jgi:transketolase C-terminal domain/subunit
VEDQYVATGLGTLVAAATADNFRVPVRRLGILDLDGAGPSGAVGPERPELSE